MSGVYAFLIGVLAVIGAWIFGKAKGSKATETKIKGEVTILRKEKEIQKEVTPVVAETASAMGAAQAEYEQTLKQIEKAGRNNDMSSLLDIARSMAQKAAERGATAQ